MTPAQVADAHQSRVIRRIESAAQKSLRLWGQVDPNNLDAAWLTLGPQIAQVAVDAQRANAVDAERYVAAAGRAQGARTDTVRLNADAFSGVDGSGRDVESLLHGAVTTTKEQVGGGAGLANAFLSGGAYLAAMMKTAVADLARSAELTGATGKGWTLYVRVVNPGACSRCAILAGMQSYKQAFLRHPACFPAGVTVAGPRLNAATRRWYQGELVTFSTTRGQDLTLTANHPVLTRRGWIPANLLVEGDEVFRSTRPEGADAIVVPDHDQVPARVEDVWRALSMGGLDRVPSSPEDFHGDGKGGEVHVVRADGALRGDLQAVCSEHVEKMGLSFRLGASQGLDGQGVPQLLDVGHAAEARGSVGGGGVLAALVNRGVSVALKRGVLGSADLDAIAFETYADYLAGNSVLLRQSEFTSASLVGLDDFSFGKVEAPRWDAPAGALSVENAGAYASRGADLLQRLTGQVETDRIVSVRRAEFSGHVYSLESVEGWHSANDYIVSNCRCTSFPIDGDNAKVVPEGLFTTPEDYFESLSKAEQDRIFTKSGADAIRVGASPSRVVSARRGATGLSYGGRETRQLRGRLERTVIGRKPDGSPVMGYATGDGTTVRGEFGKRNQRLGVGTSRTGRYSSTKRVRLMPETILDVADGDPSRARILLRDAGYLEPDYGRLSAQQLADQASSDREWADRLYRQAGFTL